MLYSELIVYRKVEITNQDASCPVVVKAYRVTKGCGYTTVKELSMADLYRGHTEWIARDIDERSRVREERASAPRRRFA